MKNNDLYPNSAVASNPLTGLFGATLTDYFIIGGILINSDNYKKTGQHNSWSISFRCNKKDLPNENSQTEYNIAIERILKHSGYEYAFKPVTRRPSGFIATLLFQKPFEFNDLLLFVENSLNRDVDESKAYASALLSGVLDGKMSFDRKNNAGAVLRLDIPNGGASDTTVKKIYSLIHTALSLLEIGEMRINTGDRQRLEGGNDRLPQIVIGRRFITPLFAQVGVACPPRQELIHNQLDLIATKEGSSKLFEKIELYPAELPGVIAFQDIKVSKKTGNAVIGDFQHGQHLVAETDGSKPVPRSKSITTQQWPVNDAQKEMARIKCRYCCELAHNHPRFPRKGDGKPFVEVHHLIPMNAQAYFNHSLDVQANLICLCPNCHSEIHYGVRRDILIEKLYKIRAEPLRRAALDISLQELLEYYK